MNDDTRIAPVALQGLLFTTQHQIFAPKAGDHRRYRPGVGCKVLRPGDDGLDYDISGHVVPPSCERVGSVGSVPVAQTEYSGVDDAMGIKGLLYGIHQLRRLGPQGIAIVIGPAQLEMGRAPV